MNDGRALDVHESLKKATEEVRSFLEDLQGSLLQLNRRGFSDHHTIEVAVLAAEVNSPLVTPFSHDLRGLSLKYSLVDIWSNSLCTILAEMCSEAGISIMKTVNQGVDGKMDTWLHGHGCEQIVHIAWQADSRDKLGAFYDAAIAAGGSDNGKPGVRAMYHPNYYTAFVMDSNRHMIEVVCHQ